jgi:Cyclic nucleotide-binding domain
MRIESSVTCISWIPSEAVEGLAKLPFSRGIAHYDPPPPDRLVDIETMHRADLFREANELKAWIEVEDGQIVDQGHGGRGRIGVTRLKLGPKTLTVPAVALPTMQSTEVGDGWVKFTQTAGGRTGAPAPRTVRGKPYFQWHSAIAWTTLVLIVYADGTSKHALKGASSFPRHWVYDKDGALVEKSGIVDFDKWYREAHEQNTPWGAEDSPAIVTQAESELERDLSHRLMGGDKVPKPFTVAEGETIFTQGEEADAEDSSVLLVIDGMLEAEVDGEVVGEVGPGAIVGERGILEGERTATLRARTNAKLVAFSADQLAREELEGVATGHGREQN